MNEFLRTFVKKTILGMIGEVAEAEFYIVVRKQNIADKTRRNTQWKRK